LARLGPAAIGSLLEPLKSDNAELRAGAIAMLAYNLKSPASFALQQSNAEQFALATQALSAALRDPDENVRLHALHALVGWAPTNEAIVKQYVAELPKLIDQSRGEQIRRIMLLLNHLGPGAAPALPNIVAAIRREKLAMPHGVDLLAHYGVPGQGALTTLAADPQLNKEVRDRAVLVIGHFKAETTPATVEVLIELLKQKQVDIRLRILQTLSSIGAAAKPAESELKRLQKDAEAGLSAIEVKYLEDSLKAIGSAK
jgi:hypothetical protein